jgi:hypothetical protein
MTWAWGPINRTPACRQSENNILASYSWRSGGKIADTVLASASQEKRDNKRLSKISDL